MTDKQVHFFRTDLARYFLARLVPGLTAIFSFIVAIRALSPEELGIYLLIIAGAGLLHILAIEWVKGYVVRELALDNSRVDLAAISFTYLRQLRVGFFILLALLFAVDYLFSLKYSSSLWFVFLGVLLFCYRSQFEVEVAILNATLQAKNYFYSRTIRNALQFIFFFALIGTDLASVTSFAICLALSYLLVSRFFNDKLLRSSMAENATRICQLAFLRRAILFGFPIAIALSVDWIVSASDKLLLSVLIDVSAAGHYGSISELLLKSITLCFVVPYLAFYPRLLAEHRRENLGGRFSKLYNFLKSILLLGVFSLVLLASIFPLQLGSWVWGASYTVIGSEILFPIVLSICFFGMKTFLIDITFHLNSNTKVILMGSVGMACLNGLGGLIFIPKYGVQGAAWVAAFALGFGMLVSLVLALRSGFAKTTFFEIDTIKPLIAIGIGYLACAVFIDEYRFMCFLVLCIAVMFYHLYERRHLLI